MWSKFLKHCNDVSFWPESLLLQVDLKVRLDAAADMGLYWNGF